MSEPISVSGGPGGIAAEYDDLRATARLLERGGQDLSGVGLALTAYGTDPVLVASGLLDPVGLTRVEVAFASALGGLAAATAHCAALAVALRGAAIAYETTDRAERELMPDLRGLTRLPHAAGSAAETLVRTRSWTNSAERFATDDPQLADLAEAAIARELRLPIPTVRGALAQRFDDGHPVVSSLGRDTGPPPRSLADLISNLARRNDGRPGEIDVSIIPGAPGQPRRVIVDIPGTKDWSLASQNPDVASLAANLRAIDGRPTSYQEGVLEALRLSGIGPGDDVLLVGHSLGGMVAVEAATTAARSGEFSISHVVTAGAPIGAVSGRVPASVQVLALENADDDIPHLDGTDNADRPNVTTVTVHHDHGDIGANHDLRRSYEPGAADVDASDDPSTRAYLDRIAPFLSGEAITTDVYEIARAP
jgi:pimeloyl-ACP methyl ester carboxylesterase